MNPIQMITCSKCGAKNHSDSDQDGICGYCGDWILPLPPTWARTLNASDDEQHRALHGSALEIMRMNRWLMTIEELESKYDFVSVLNERRGLKVWAEETFGPFSRHTAVALNNLGGDCVRCGLFAEAEGHLSRAAEINAWHFGTEHPRYAVNIGNLAKVYRELGSLNRAEQYAKNALNIFEAAPADPSNIVTALNELAEILKQKGSYAQSERIYRRALEVLAQQRPGDKVETAKLTKNLADVLGYEGRFEEAKAAYEEAYRIFFETLGSRHYLTALALDGMAINVMLYALSMPRELITPFIGAAIKYEEEALDIITKSMGIHHPMAATVASHLAILHLYAGQVSKAEEILSNSILETQKSRGQENLDYMSMLCHFANVQLMLGQENGAEEWYNKALNISEKFLGSSNPRTGLILHNVAMLKYAQGNIKEAIRLCARSDEILYQETGMIFTMGSEATRRAFADSRGSRLHINITLHAVAAPQDADALRLAVNTVIKTKGLLTDAASDTLRVTKEELSPTGRLALDNLIAAYARKAAGAQEQDESIEQVDSEISHLEECIREESVLFREHTLDLSIEAVQAALHENSAIIEFVFWMPFEPKSVTDPNIYGLCSPRYIAYLIPASGAISFADLGPSAPIDELIRSFRTAIVNHEQEQCNLFGRILYNHLFMPFADSLREISLLSLAPDAVLHVLPFSALIDSEGRTLMERHLLNYLNCSRDILRYNETQSTWHSASPEHIFADPDYDFQYSSERSQLDGKPSDAPSQKSMHFDRLPGTAAEAAHMVSLFPDTVVLTGAEATKLALLKVKSPRILHIATHGYFIPAAPSLQEGPRTEDLGIRRLRDALVSLPGESIPDVNNVDWAEVRPDSERDSLLRSGLALAGANCATPSHGLITALEISGLDLRGTELTVLSACDTGLGDIVIGDGVYGLRRALTIAGTASQLMSLWRIDDLATKEFMQEFFAALVAGRSRAEALRAAQVVMQKSVDHNELDFWACFVLMGDPGPLRASRSPLPQRAAKVQRPVEKKVVQPSSFGAARRVPNIWSISQTSQRRGELRQNTYKLPRFSATLAAQTLGIFGCSLWLVSASKSPASHDREPALVFTMIAAFVSSLFFEVLCDIPSERLWKRGLNQSRRSGWIHWLLYLLFSSLAASIVTSFTLFVCIFLAHQLSVDAPIGISMQLCFHVVLLACVYHERIYAFLR